MQYTLKMVSNELTISKDALVDVRNMLGIKEIYEKDFKRIEYVVAEIRRRYGKCTLSTINRYKLWAC